jgi:hypothetical protein
VKLDGPDDAMVELEASARTGGDAIGFPGDTLGVRSVVLRAKVTKGIGQTVRFVRNGKPEEAVAITTDPFVHETIAPAPAQGEDRWRAEALVEEKPRTVTSHVWLRLDPSGPAASEAAKDDDGCGVARERRADFPLGIAAAALGLVVFRLVKRRR